MADKIYMDNNSTSWPKPPGVAKAVSEYIEDVGCNLNRSGFGTTCVLNRKARSCREQLAALFNYPNFMHVVTTPSITFALNTVIKGLLSSGDHALVSGMEHNAVTRPLFQLREFGIEFDFIPGDSAGRLDPASIAPRIRPNTRMVVTTHASNVCGTILPIREIGAICREKELLYVVDSAQSAGVLPLDMQADNIDVLCFAGHKALLGPPGIGGFILAPELAARIRPLVVGGTGVESEQDEVPDALPMHFESGTPNLMGFYGLCASLKWLNRQGIERIHKKEQETYRSFLAGMQQIKGLRIVGTQDADSSLCVLAIEVPGLDIGAIAYRLDSKHRVITRCGLHCAPWANRSLGTFPKGTIRLSPGYFTKKSEVTLTLAALEESVAYARRRKLVDR
ncbi:MAG: aminotransferase class V-fold PLP-dependent enzyme [Coriobacteriales bacterium]|jgi:cysteine desulfurase family protein|nr:aminotransferase class V-fold PLP-dependent enzyme [Coriobacteriales bacterium]